MAATKTQKHTWNKVSAKGTLLSSQFGIQFYIQRIKLIFSHFPFNHIVLMEIFRGHSFTRSFIYLFPAWAVVRLCCFHTYSTQVLVSCARLLPLSPCSQSYASSLLLVEQVSTLYPSSYVSTFAIFCIYFNGLLWQKFCLRKQESNKLYEILVMKLYIFILI